MATTINADTSNGLVMTPDTSGEIKLQSAGTDIVSVTANGIDVTGGFTVDTNTLYVDSTNNRVGIGTSSPADPLQISHATTSRMRFSETTNSLTLNVGQWSAKNRIEGSGGSDLIISNYDASNPIAFYTGSGGGNVERMRIDSSGNVGIGTSSPSTTLHVKSPTTTASAVFAATIEQGKTNNGTATTGLRVKYTSVSPVDSNHIFRCEDSGGTYRFYVQNNGTHGGTSDRTLKENIVDATDKLTDLRKIKVRNYNWIEHGPEGGFKELGFIAQEVEEVFPKLVKENPETGKKMLLDSVFVPILVKALQEAADKIDALETRIQTLESV